MLRQTYVPGTSFAVISDRGVAMLPGDVPVDLTETVWAALNDGAGLGAVLQSLTAAFGTSLALIPPFAVAIFSGDEVRVAVRGSFAIVVTEPGAAESLTVSGRDITTWSERVVTGATALVLRHTQTAPDDSSAATRENLAIRSGVVLADAVHVVLTAERSLPPAAAARTESDVPRAEETRGTPPVAETAPTRAAQAPDELEPVQPTSVEDVHDTSGDTVGDAHGDTDDDRAGDTSADALLEVEDTRADIPDEAYDHLWGATVVKSVESAAVRDVDDDDDLPPTPGSPAIEPHPSTEPVPPTPAATGLPTPPAPADWTAPPATGLIDRVPGFSSAIGAPAPTATPAPASAAAAAAAAADHDGLTITVSELDALRRLGTASDSLSDPSSGAASESLPAQHVSHGTIRLSTGDTITLDRTIIVGRRPRANRVDADRMPTLVTVPSPEQDISRNHLEVRIEGRHVLAVDLETTNGSVLHRDGTPPARLTPHEPTLLLEGDLIDVGDGVTLTFEGLK